MWYFRVTKPDGRKYEQGSYPSEELATTMAGEYASEFPDDTVGAVEEESEEHVPIAETARVWKDDGSRDVYYNDGTIVNVS